MPAFVVSFVTPCVLEGRGVHQWRVARDLVCDTPFGRIVVPEGFITDGASVPRIFQNIFPPLDGDYDAAAVLHDYVYQHAVALGRTKADADNLLKAGMEAMHTAAWKRFLIYQGVHRGGQLAWDADRRKETAAMAATK